MNGGKKTKMKIMNYHSKMKKIIVDIFGWVALFIVMLSLGIWAFAIFIFAGILKKI